ncbi:MAG: excinuclease ABC subunit UvrA [Calditrichae bacterium]|nr:excinuclease ABC subunit UvrA [Calditrichia bacterium]
MSKKEYLIVKGAREHNLQNIDLQIPREKLVVITGLSGSGKSSLAFDTIYAEGQRRYVESLSAYARQFLGLMEKPDVDYIDGLSPAISIEQKTTHKNPRSTVGTVTEIYDYLRLLFARIGHPHCYNCGDPIARQTPQQIVDTIMALPEGTRIQILGPVVRGRKGEYKELFEEIKREGFLRVRVDGRLYSLDEEITLNKKIKHNIEVVVDRLKVSEKIRQRLTESVEIALKMASGLMILENVEEAGERLFSENFACKRCNISYEEIEPRMFSFNSPYGACPSCDGLGSTLEIDPRLLVPDPRLSIRGGAVESVGEERNSWYYEMIAALAREFGFSLDTPWKDLPEEAQRLVLYGTGDQKVRFKFEREHSKFEFSSHYEGAINNLYRRYRQTSSQHIRTWIEGFMNQIPCTECNGARLRNESLGVKVNDLNIAEVTAKNIRKAHEFFNSLTLNQREQTIAYQILKEIRSRLEFLLNVGLDYLSLDRTAGTLSGGEAQRIRLATQIGSQLVGVLYVLDEPSIGLHQRDNSRLIDTLLKLRDLGNTVLVVEHDRETIEQSDYIIDLGPRAGKHGGRVVAEGTPEEVAKNPQSITGAYLSYEKYIEVPKKRRKGNGKQLVLSGAQGNNLKEVTAKFPLGKFICITGVSGSGKSSLINETLYPLLAAHFHRSKRIPLEYRGVEGLEHLDKVIDIDQSPIGRTPRSNPATYTGLFTHIRDLFAQLPEAKIRGYKPGRFSFNVKGGRCNACEGDGVKKIEMHFLPDVYVTCETCKGRRYNRETLEIRYRGKNIADVLDMTVEEALEFFAKIPAIKRKLQTLHDVGLDYIHLGQRATTLSGGEAQRVKLATELSRLGTGSTVYILDEPTTGLHFEDITMLLKVLNRLVDKGNTVIVIEHNMDVIKTADWIIDIGPEGGDDGGQIIAEGTPEAIMKTGNSYTGQFLVKEMEHWQTHRQKQEVAEAVSD